MPRQRVECFPNLGDIMLFKQIRRGLTCAFVPLLLFSCFVANAEEDTAETMIWPRVVDGMALGNSARKEVTSAAKYYARHRKQLVATLDRSSPYLWHIVNAVEKRNMPMEIALLPAIESGFNAEAHSKRRAGGLWQFVPATARLYGLNDTADYSARYDPIASTQAALKYLDRLHDRYGDWLLALAAYNAGTVRVNRDIEKARSRNFWALKLPKETRRHVANLLGLALIVRHPERYGVNLPSIPDKLVTEVLLLDQPKNIASAAEQVGVPHESVMAYNPALKNLKNTSLQSAVLLLPSDAIKLREELTRGDYPPVQAQVPESETRPPQAHKHRITTGDTLWGIARRYGVSVRQLQDWNHLGEKSALKAGRVLVVASSK